MQDNPDDGVVTVQPLDSMRRRLYIAPLGLYLTLDAGTFDEVAINPVAKSVKLTLSEAGQFTPRALLRIEQPAKVAGVTTFKPTRALQSERGGFVIALQAKPTVVELTVK